MDAPRWTEVVATFDELVELDPGQQEERLAAIGAADVELRHSVEELLAADAQAEDRLARIDQALTPSRSARPEGVHDADPLKLVGRAVSHFRVIEPLAYGGMGVVYRAEDTQLNRAIALKFPLPAHHFDHSARERFLREARVAAALDHPNLCAIHEVGETEDGHLFYAMPLYLGETLKERLAREGALPVADAFHIARQIATGLSAAHNAGIVHRDLKPANVMLLGDGTVKILDFGLARRSDVSVTDPWTTLGTVSYMSPEQVQGHQLDRRADLWALGVVLHEMLTGQRPFRGEHAITVAHAIVNNEPDRPSTLRAGISDHADALVQTLLRKDPAKRYASAEDVIAVLNTISMGPRTPHPSGPDADRSDGATWLGAFAMRIRPAVTGQRAAWGGARRTVITSLAATGVLAISAAAWLAFRPDRSLLASGVLVERQPLVVADFQAAGSDSGIGPTLGRMFSRYLGESRLITVMPRSRIDSVLRLMRLSPGTPLDPVLARDVAQRFGVRAVVTGDLTPLGRRYVLTVRLVSAATGDALASYDETAANDDAVIPRLESMGRKLRGKIGESLKDISAGPPLRALTTTSIPALHILSDARREPDFKRHTALLREAIALDTTFAYAYLVLAIHLSAGRHGSAARDSMLARAYLLRDHLTQMERTAVTAFYWNVPGRDRGLAIEAYEAQVARDSADRISILNLGVSLNGVQNFARTESLMRRFEAVLNRSGLMNLALAQVGQGRVDAADSTIDRIEARPEGADVFVLQTRAVVALAALRFDSAALFTKRWRAMPQANATVPPFGTLIALARTCGRLNEAWTLTTEAEGISVAAGSSSSGLAETVAAASEDLWLRGHPANARRRLDGFFRGRPIAPGGSVDERIDHLRAAALYAASGRPDTARSILAAVMATADSVARRAMYSQQQVTLGEIAIAERSPLDAMAAFRRSDLAADGLPVSACVVCVLPRLARAAERAGWADSSRVLWERYVTTASAGRLESDSWFLAMAYRELRRLYARAGNRQKSAEFDGRLADLWKDADPDLRERMKQGR